MVIVDSTVYSIQQDLELCDLLLRWKFLGLEFVALELALMNSNSSFGSFSFDLCRKVLTETISVPSRFTHSAEDKLTPFVGVVAVYRRGVLKTSSGTSLLESMTFLGTARGSDVHE